MKKKTDLHALIQALSRAEKRYFTLDARKAGRSQSRYLQLFQAINQQDAYDEKSLKVNFGKKLNDDKRRLYEAILRSMRDYRAQRSRTARIKELLLDAKFLYERGLYEQTNIRLQEASRIAVELEDQLAILEINREFRRVLNTLTGRSDDEALKSLIKMASESLALLQVEFDNLNNFDQLIREVQRSKSTEKTERETLSAQYDELLFDTELPHSIRGKLRRYQSRAIYAQLMGDLENVYLNFKAAVDCWNLHPRFKQEDFNRYLNDAFNLLKATFNYPPAISEASILLDQLSNEEPANLHDQAVLFQRTTTYRLFHAINYDARRPADDILLPIQEKLEKIDLHPVSEMTIRFNAAILYFIQGASARCEEWLQSIIDQKKNTLRPDISLSSRLLRLLTLLDQGMDSSFLEAQLRSDQRQFAKAEEDVLTDFGKWLIRLLKQYLNTPVMEQKQFLHDARKQLTDNWSNLPLELDKLIDKWLEARSLDKKVIDLM